MSYFEIGNVLYRGALNAATGSARFKLTADAINAVDTINIASGEVVYFRYLYYNSPRTVYANSPAMTLQIEPDRGVTFLEISAFMDVGKHVDVGGVPLPARYRSALTNPICSYVSNYRISAPTSVRVIAASTTTSYQGWLAVRYIKETGSD